MVQSQRMTMFVSTGKLMWFNGKLHARKMQSSKERFPFGFPFGFPFDFPFGFPFGVPFGFPTSNFRNKLAPFSHSGCLQRDFVDRHGSNFQKCSSRAGVVRFCKAPKGTAGTNEAGGQGRRGGTQTRNFEDFWGRKPIGNTPLE